MSDLQAAYYELVDLLQISDELISADIQEMFLTFVRRLKRVLDFEAIVLFRYDAFEEEHFSAFLHFGFQEFAAFLQQPTEMVDVYDWMLKRGASICLPSSLAIGKNDLLLPLQQFKQKLGILHLITSLDPLDISRHQQIVLNFFGQQMSRSLLYSQVLMQKEDDLQREKIHSLGLILSGIMHELNSPLTAIHGYAELLYDNLQEQHLLAESDEYLSILKSETRRVMGIVKSMLKYVRRQPLQMEPVSLHECIQYTLSLLDFELKSLNLKVNADIRAENDLLLGDAVQCQQIIFNLLSNAIQAFQQRNHIEQPQLWITTHNTANKLIVTLSDNAGGIPKEHLNRIFDPFFSTKSAHTGTGLGLSLVDKMVSEHGGNIKVWNTLPPEQVGACFQITFPVAQPNPLDKRPQNQALLAEHPAKILLVDNEPIILQYMETILRNAKFELQLVSQAEAALQALETENFDLVISDFFLDKMNGRQLFNAIQDQGLNSKILFLTGAVLDESFRQFLQKHHLTCLYKPFYAEELLEMVNQLLRETA